MSEIKLTQLSHGGGCKIAPALLQEILGTAKEKLPYANLLVGTETSDSARGWLSAHWLRHNRRTYCSPWAMRR